MSTPAFSDLPDGLASHLAQALRRTSGLEIDLVGARSVERAVAERIHALSRRGDLRDAWGYLDRIEQDADERQWLVEAAVVPETWFFRHRESFEFLALQARQRVFGAHAMARSPASAPGMSSPSALAPLRIASVPCSTGEEPYSIAMTLIETGISPKAFLIDAMDISGAALAQAQVGRYRLNAFRGCPEAQRDRFFTRVPVPVSGSSIHETVWEINRDVSACVSFRQANLVLDAAIGTPVAGAGRDAGTYDFIFCRNVLIYFDRPTQAAVIDKLRRALRPGGFLLTGPAEAALVSRAGLAAAAAPLAFAFHREAAAPRNAGGTGVTDRLGVARTAVATSAFGTVSGVPGMPGMPGVTAASPHAQNARPGNTPAGGAAAGSRAASGLASSSPVARPRGATSLPSPTATRPGGASAGASTIMSGHGIGRSTDASVKSSASDASVPPASAGMGNTGSTGGIHGGTPKSIGTGSPPRSGAAGASGPVSMATTRADSWAAGLAEAEQLANLGDIDQALDRCHALRAAGAASADLYCLLGVLADAKGLAAEAREHFRRALYLDANHAGALLQFSEHLALAGDSDGSQRLMARARRAHPDLF